MLDLGMLDVLIGLVTIYLTFAVACTAIVEAISSWLKLRSRNLENGMNELFAGEFKDGEKIVEAFYGHPLIQSLSKGQGGRPSYIAPELVGKVVESVVIAKSGVSTLEGAIDDLPDNSHIKTLLQHFVQESKEGAQHFRQIVASHFDETMVRVSGWFKRRTRWVTLAVAFVMVASVNVDTIDIVTALASDPSARAELVKLSQDQLSQTLAAQDKAADQGEDVVKQSEADTKAAREAVARAIQAFEATGLQLGWGHATLSSGSAYFSKIIGLLVSLFAISLGAPFWFRILQKFDAVRSSGEPGKQAASQAESDAKTGEKPDSKTPKEA